VRSFPPIEGLLPHAGAMHLLDRVLEHGPGGTVCDAHALRAALFRGADERIPAWVAIEWMAQCAGAHGALELLARGERLGLGFLTGGRQIRLYAAHVADDALLVIQATPHGRSGGLHAFVCRVTLPGGTLLAEGRLGIFVPRPALAAQGAA